MAINQYLYEQLNKRCAGLNLTLPPNCLTTMGAQYIDFDEIHKSLSAQFIVKEDYQNPMGMMQGGFIMAAVDNVIGPLSYLLAPPSVTTSLTCTFVRPIKPDTPSIIVKAEVKEQTTQYLHMSAAVSDENKKLLVLATASAHIVQS